MAARNQRLLLRELENDLLIKQSDVESLTQRQARLRARSHAARAVLSQCEALLALAAALQRDPPDNGGSSGSGDTTPAPKGNSSPPVSWDDQLAAHMQELNREWVDSEWAGDNVTACMVGGGVAAAATAAAATHEQPICLGWSPGRAAQAAATAELTTAGLRSKLQEFACNAGRLLLRIRHAAPDAADARCQLASRRCEVLGLIALIAVRPPAGLWPLTAVQLAPLDGSAGAGVAAAEAHWRFAAAQLALEDSQV
jgi:hypothetical protein